MSWLHSLAYQREDFNAALLHAQGELRLQPHLATSTPPSPFWCDERSPVLCASTLADQDPFRNIFYTTNPTLYNRQFWIRHFASIVAVLGDARAVEESVTVSYMWRVSPGFTVGFSPGLFRHKRVDRELFQTGENVRDAVVAEQLWRCAAPYMERAGGVEQGSGDRLFSGGREEEGAEPRPHAPD